VVIGRTWWRAAVLSVVLAGAMINDGILGYEAVRAQPASPPVAAQEFMIVPTESQVIYRVGETLIADNNRFNVAVGTTQAIRGAVTVDRVNPRASRIGPITIDISQFQSDAARRDTAIRRQWLESAKFPSAEFTPTQVDGLPAQYVDGRAIPLRITGTLRVRNMPRPTTFDATVTLTGQQLTGQATTKVLMTDFGFSPPDIFGILRAQNEVVIEFRFTARPASTP
jgi:polyisoprenoid-binding protein YceI